jgi:hypothetical protein
MPGAPRLISVNVSHPSKMLRTIIGVQRSAKISAPRAMGHWP